MIWLVLLFLALSDRCQACFMSWLLGLHTVRYCTVPWYLGWMCVCNSYMLHVSPCPRQLSFISMKWSETESTPLYPKETLCWLRSRHKGQASRRTVGWRRALPFATSHPQSKGELWDGLLNPTQAPIVTKNWTAYGEQNADMIHCKETPQGSRRREAQREKCNDFKLDCSIFLQVKEAKGVNELDKFKTSYCLLWHKSPCFHTLSYDKTETQAGTVRVSLWPLPVLFPWATFSGHMFTVPRLCPYVIASIIF